MEIIQKRFFSRNVYNFYETTVKINTIRFFSKGEIIVDYENIDPYPKKYENNPVPLILITAFFCVITIAYPLNGLIYHKEFSIINFLFWLVVAITLILVTISKSINIILYQNIDHTTFPIYNNLSNTNTAKKLQDLFEINRKNRIKVKYACKYESETKENYNDRLKHLYLDSILTSEEYLNYQEN